MGVIFHEQTVFSFQFHHIWSTAIWARVKCDSNLDFNLDSQKFLFSSIPIVSDSFESIYWIIVLQKLKLRFKWCFLADFKRFSSRTCQYTALFIVSFREMNAAGSDVNTSLNITEPLPVLACRDTVCWLENYTNFPLCIAIWILAELFHYTNISFVYLPSRIFRHVSSKSHVLLLFISLTYL